MTPDLIAAVLALSLPVRLALLDATNEENFTAAVALLREVVGG